MQGCGDKQVFVLSGGALLHSPACLTDYQVTFELQTQQLGLLCCWSKSKLTRV
jgi:hypothetical protein